MKTLGKQIALPKCMKTLEEERLDVCQTDKLDGPIFGGGRG